MFFQLGHSGPSRTDVEGNRLPVAHAEEATHESRRGEASLLGNESGRREIVRLKFNKCYEVAGI